MLMVPTDARVLLAGIWPAAPANVKVTKVVTDNRNVVKDSIFVAIKGERVDGHNYAAKAIEMGALAVVAQHAVEGVSATQTVLVRDPLDAMIAIGANYRNQFSPLVLGVTGSVGKTTCKEFCAAVFESFGNTLKTQGNQNNEIGLPNTLFNMNENTQYAVLEMGMQGFGEINKLAVAAKPNAAIITKIGTAHIRQLGTVENILRAKLEICDGLPKGAPLVLNGDDELLWAATLPTYVNPVFAGINNLDCEVTARNIVQKDGGQEFTIFDRSYGEFLTYIPAVGQHNIENALLAYTAATRLGLSAEIAAGALSRYKTTGMRQNIVCKSEMTFIEDCYNANPDSMAAALLTLAQVGENSRRIAVLGDMLDLGEVAQQAHMQVGRLCAETGVDLLFTVGPLALLIAEEAQKLGVEATVCENNRQAIEFLRNALQKGDTVLFKASRGMQFEEIIDGVVPAQTVDK